MTCCCLLSPRKMSHIAQTEMSPVRLGLVGEPSGRANEVIYVKPSSPTPSLPSPVLVFFGGDVQDYPEVMAAHRDHKRYVDWSLTSTASLLAAKFPAHHVLIIKPSRMERKTFSCYDNFVISNSVGAPTHAPEGTALTYLASLILETLRKAQALQTSIGDENPTADQGLQGSNIDDSSQSLCHKSLSDITEAQECNTDLPKTNDHCLKNELKETEFSEVSFIGFSKGCVVLNQIITELHTLMAIQQQTQQQDGFIKKIRNMYWLDGGHAGGRDTWITSPSILKSLAARQHITIHIHVTPYQVRDEFRPWIGKECKSFHDILRRAGAKVNYSLHFEEEAPTLLLHFNVLNHFT